MKPAVDRIERPATLLSVTDLHVQYAHPQGKVRAVDGVSLRVEEGEILALIGESGAGKSSVARGLLRLLPEPAGRVIRGQVRFRGTDLLRAGDRALAALRGGSLAYLPPDPVRGLGPRRSIGVQIEEAALRLGAGEARRSGVEALLLEVGLEPIPALLDARAADLPPATCRRVMIAMAMAAEPELIVTDEPLARLGAIEAAELVDLLARLRKRHGHALLLLSRDPGLAAALANRTAVLYAGRVVESAPTGHLFDLPRHPYTQLLLRSRFRIDKPATEAAEPIPGEAPNRHRVAPGCPFEPRCPLAHEPCASAYPPEIRVSGQHVAACWLLEE